MLTKRISKVMFFIEWAKISVFNIFYKIVGDKRNRKLCSIIYFYRRDNKMVF